MATFEQFFLDPTILAALEKLNYKAPSPIQTEAIPKILQNLDLIALAKTGSGKTAACAIPICQKVQTSSSKVQALIIVPTRELALQYAVEAQKIGHYKGVKAFAIYGGEDASLQLSKIKAGVHVLVATPGRLIDFIYSRLIDLTTVEMLVLDEADEMLSMGFYDDLEFIIQCLIHEHQTLLFSATMPAQIKAIARKHMKNPQEISLNEEEVSPKSLEHHFLYCRHHEREGSMAALMKELKPHQSLVFCRSRHECEAVCKALKKQFDGVDFLHAGLTQDVRSIVTNKFRKGIIRTLVATDIASRGLDFSKVSHVFIYHLGDDPDVYVHRAGRTGRFEKAGVVVTLVTDRELSTLNRVLHHIGREPIWIGEPPSEGPPPKKSRPPLRRRPQR